MSATIIVISYCHHFQVFHIHIAFIFTVLLNNISLGAYTAQIRQMISNHRHLSAFSPTHFLNLNNIYKTHTHTHIYIYIYTHIYIHIYTYIYMCKICWKQISVFLYSCQHIVRIAFAHGCSDLKTMQARLPSHVIRQIQSRLDQVTF